MADAETVVDAPSPVATRPAWATTRTRPAPVLARVIGLQSSDGASIAMVAAGVAQGIASDWRCELVNDREEPVDGDDCTIIRTDQRMTVLKTKLDPEQVRIHSRARLTPP
jgi:hypothetical protein